MDSPNHPSSQRLIAEADKESALTLKVLEEFSLLINSKKGSQNIEAESTTGGEVIQKILNRSYGGHN